MTENKPRPPAPRRAVRRLRVGTLVALVVALAATLVIAALARRTLPVNAVAANATPRSAHSAAAAPAAKAGSELASLRSASTPTEARKMELPTYTVLRTPRPITVDGVLDEPVWRRLKPVGAFVVEGGSPAEFETEAKLCWDDKHLYVAFSCIDNDIWGTYTKRDDPLYEQEVCEIFINPSGDLVNYYEFEVSPRNVVWDGRIYNPDGARSKNFRGEPEWNCEGLLTGVRVAGTLDDRSDLDQVWTVEMAIPFAQLVKRPPTDRERWRANLYRIDRGEKDEYSSWSATLTDKPDFHVPKRFGTLIFSAREA
jgi:hypothetical protein